MFLIVSQPPYDVEKVLKPAAAALEIIPYEMRSKLSYPLPEVWKIYDTPEKANSSLRGLESAGINALLISAEDLGNAPPPFSAISFSLAESSITAKNKLQETLELPWDSTRLALLLQRVAEEEQTNGSKTESREPGAALGKLAAGVGNILIPGLGSVVLNARNATQQALKTSLGAGTVETAVERILDIYAESEKGKWVRLRLSQNALDYSGLGEARGMGSQENWLKLLSLLKERVPERLWDEGCLKMRPRPMVVEGAPFHRLVQGKIPNEISKAYPEFYSVVRWLGK